MATTKVIKLDRNTAKKITQGIIKPIKNPKPLFKILVTRIDRDTMKTFDNQGQWEGRKKWPPFSPKTLRTEVGTWKIRYGTDKRPKRTMEQLNKYKTEHGLWFKRGYMKGYESDRRYGGNSKLLQASGMFRASFRKLKETNKSITYGTNHKLAGKIGSKPVRQVLQYTKTDQKRYGKLIKTYWIKGMF